MPSDFDPYYQWLGIPPAEQPANHYRLLGIPPFETNLDVISNAADARMAFIRTFQSGPKSAESQQLPNALATARTTLLNPERKSSYDRQLPASAGLQAAVSIAKTQSDVQQQALVNLQHELEMAQAREGQLAQLQVQYAAALAQNQALQQTQAEREMWVSVNTVPAVTAVRSARKPQMNMPWPLTIAGIGAGVALLVIVLGYIAARLSNQQVSGASLPGAAGSVPTVAVSPSTRLNPPTTSPTPVRGEKTSPVPSQPDSTEEIDLLAQIETPRDVHCIVPGNETVKRNGILRVQHPNHFVSVTAPQLVPDNFQVNVRVTARQGEGFVLGFPIRGHGCMLSIDGFAVHPGGTRTALEMIDGRRPQVPGYPEKAYFGRLLKENVESQLSLRVSGNAMEFLCDGKSIFSWSGDPARLSVWPDFDPEKKGRFWVACWAAHYDVSSITLRQLGEQ